MGWFLVIVGAMGLLSFNIKNATGRQAIFALLAWGTLMVAVIALGVAVNQGWFSSTTT